MHRKSLIFSDLDSLHQKLKSVETLRKNETCDSIRNVLNDTADIENTILSELRALLQASLRNIMHLILLKKEVHKVNVVSLRNTFAFGENGCKTEMLICKVFVCF